MHLQSTEKKCFQETVETSFKKCEQCVQNMPIALRDPVKEVIVAIVSDLDSKQQGYSDHCIPVAYGLSGYNLTLMSMRFMMDDIVSICDKKNIVIRTI